MVLRIVLPATFFIAGTSPKGDRDPNDTQMHGKGGPAPEDILASQKPERLPPPERILDPLQNKHRPALCILPILVAD